MKLQKNESTPDRAIRIVLAVALLALALSGAIAAPWLYLAGAVGAILAITGIVGICPLYALLRVSTRSAER